MIRYLEEVNSPTALLLNQYFQILRVWFQLVFQLHGWVYLQAMVLVLVMTDAMGWYHWTVVDLSE